MSLLVDRPVKVHAPAALPILQPHAAFVRQYAGEPFQGILHPYYPFAGLHLDQLTSFLSANVFPLKLGVNFPLVKVAANTTSPTSRS